MSTEIHKISSGTDLDRLLDHSHEHPVWIFKHSLVCSLSRRAEREYRRFAEQAGAGAELALLEIQNARPLSAAVAERTGVTHESPQAILLRAGQPVWHGSHFEIDVATLERVQAEHAPAPPGEA